MNDALSNNWIVLKNDLLFSSSIFLNEAKLMGSDDIFFYVKRDIKRIHLDEKHAINISQIDKVIKNLK